MNDTSLSWSDILLEALKRSGACGADLLQSVNTDVQYDHISKRQEFLIFALAPTCVLILIVVNWFLGGQGRTQAEIAQSVALLAIFLGGGNRFIRGIQDLFLRRRVTVDVFVSVALAATMAIGEFLSAAIVIFIMAVSGAVEGYTMDKSTRSIQRFLSLAPKTATLLVAAPCALAIGTPTAVSAAMANMTRKGVFIKGGAYFEAAGKLDVLMLDKTGTLTTGVPTVSEIWTVNGVGTEEVLYWAASAERDSSHPFARALRREAEQKKVALGKTSDFVSITGSGVRAAVDGAVVAVGRPEYIKGLCSNSFAMMEFAEDERSIVAVSVDGRLCGIVQFEDQLRTNAKQSIEAIQRMVGSDHVILLSGDRQETAAAFGGKVGITRAYGDLMPGDKEHFVERYQQEGMQVGMLGTASTTRPRWQRRQWVLPWGGAGRSSPPKPQRDRETCFLIRPKSRFLPSPGRISEQHLINDILMVTKH